MLRLPDEKIELIQTPEPDKISLTNSNYFETLSGVLRELVPQGICALMLTHGTSVLCFFRSRGVNAQGLFSTIIAPGELARLYSPPN